MYTNDCMTLYHKEYDKNTRKNKWIRQVIEKVNWQGGLGASINKGYDKANDVTIFVPIEKNDLSNIKFEIGDIVVKGNISKNIETQQDLQGIKDVYNLTTIIPNLFGTTRMQHYELGGK